MVENSKIEWTTHTFNPWIGCAKVSPGCENCYAEADFDKRKGRVKWGVNGTRSLTSDSYWRNPIKWDRDAEAMGDRPRVFCASLADVFEDFGGPLLNSKGEELRSDGEGWFGTVADAHAHDESPVGKVWHRRANLDHVRYRLAATIQATPHLDWLLLTKRPENVNRMASEAFGWTVAKHGLPPNCWIGTSVENQKTADERIPHLLKIPAAVRFLSCEPLLGPVGLQLLDEYPHREHWPKERTRAIDWVIVGGESGHGARPCNVDWIRDIRDQCRAAGVPCFIKQLGKSYYEDNKAGARRRYSTDDPKGGDWENWPEDLRVREFPSLGVTGG